MKKIKLALLISSLFTINASFAQESVSATEFYKMTAEERQADFTKVLVKLKEGATIEDFLQKNSLNSIESKPFSMGYYSFILLGKVNPQDLVDNEIVESAQEDRILRLDPQEKQENISIQDNGDNRALSNTVLFNDLYLSQQNYMKSNQEFVGASSILSALAQKFDLTQQPQQKVRIAVVDTGNIIHNDIVYGSDSRNFSLLYKKAATDKAELARTEGAKDLTYIGSNECTSGHGGAVAHVISALRNNTQGTAGIIEADIVGLRSLSYDCTQPTPVPEGYESDTINAILWASGSAVPNVEQLISKKVDIINLSLGSTSTCSPALQSAINVATSNGIIVVVSAGNNNVNASTASPANCQGVITVGSNDINGHKADFSNFGSNVTLTALGENIVTANKDGITYNFSNGTSFSAPIVSGISGLLKQRYAKLNQSEVKDILVSTAVKHPTNFPQANKDCTNGNCGAGVVDALGAVNYADQIKGLTLKAEHLYNNKNSCEDTKYIEQMKKLYNVCDVYNIELTEKSRFKEMTYQVVSKNYAENEWSQVNTTVVDSIKIPSDKQKTVYRLENKDDKNSYGVRVCDMGDEQTNSDDKCYTVSEIDFSQVVKPNACN